MRLIFKYLIMLRPYVAISSESNNTNTQALLKNKPKERTK
jgi:hypothetical protein